MLDWVFWATAMCALVVCVLFGVLYGWSDIKCVWPPCLSELIEVHKTIIMLFFGWACSLVWLNLTLISLIHRSEPMLILALLVYLSFLGVMAFDLNAHWIMHYLAVGSYMGTSTAYVYLGRTDKNEEVTAAVIVLTILFVLAIVVKLAGGGSMIKYFYTIAEICWVLSLFVYTLICSYAYRFDFNILITTFNHTEAHYGI